MSALNGLTCIRCDAIFPVEPRFDGCPSCSSVAPANLTPKYDLTAIKRVFNQAALRDRPSDMWRYRELLPPDPHEVSSMGEGMTPLIASRKWGRELGVPRLFFKDESRNPTGSFKDRLAATALAMAPRFGARTVGVSSTGNAAAATAAYAACKGLPCVVLTVKSASSAMTTQIRAYGAMVVATEKKSDRWRLLQAGVKLWGWYPTSPFFGPPIGSNPYGIDGYKTIAYEICEQLDWRAPDWCVLPVAYGDGLFGISKGFDELATLGLIDRRPRMVAAEMAGSLGAAMRAGNDIVPEAVPPTPSAAASINVGQSTYQALYALRASGGLARTAVNSELFELQASLAACEGIYAELSSLAALSVLRGLRSDEVIQERDLVVVVITASGLKGAGAAASPINDIPVVSGDIEAFRETLGQTYGYTI
jgi:threonine synthase